MATVISPQILSPTSGQSFNQGEITITWEINDPPALEETISSTSISYELDYTDDYRGNSTNWYAVKRRIPATSTTHTWRVGKMLKSSSVRIRLRARTSFDESVSDWSISDSFSVNVFKLIAPEIVSPVENNTYSDHILIILDETSVKDTYNQKVRYSLDFSSNKQELDWQTIASQLPVGRNVIRWNLDDVPSSDDYILRLTVQNSSCENETKTEADQIAKRFVYNIKIQQLGAFLIDTKPPEAVLEIEGGTTVTNQLEQIVNIFAQDTTTEVSEVRMRECDAGSILSLGDLEDPYDPLGGCLSLVDIISDFDKFGKSIKFSPKTQWVFRDESGLRKLEAILKDAGGNTSLQEQVKVFIAVFSSIVGINDFVIIVEQRDKITIDDTTSSPAVTATPSIFEVVYLATTDGNLWILEPFPRLLYNIGTSQEIKKLVEYNDFMFFLSYDTGADKSYFYRHNSTEAMLLKTFTNITGNARISPSAFAEFNSVLYMGFANGELWSYNGVSFASLSLPITASISSLYGDRLYLYIGFSNNDTVILYNGQQFSTLELS